MYDFCPWDESNDTDNSDGSFPENDEPDDSNPEIAIFSTGQSPEIGEGITQGDGGDDSSIQFRLKDIPEPTDYEQEFDDEKDSPVVDEGGAQIYGDPESDATLWQRQTYPDTCALMSQGYVLKSCLGIQISEDELAHEAMSKGYYTPGVGTYPDYLGNLLRDHGIEIERSDGNTIDDIKDKLSKNQKIIVTIDGNEIWKPSEDEQLKDLFYMPEANHAVMVTGYENSSETVYLNDPYHPKGNGLEIALEDFSNAWNDSGNFMVSTVNAS